MDKNRLVVDEQVQRIIDGDATRPGAPDLLREWWMQLADTESEVVVAKMREYGGDGRAMDLVDIGRDLLRAQGVPESRITDDWATEVGIYFYARGKMSRWTAAVIRGDRVSNDTLHDLGVYTRMAQRTRFAGGWPQ